MSFLPRMRVTAFVMTVLLSVVTVFTVFGIPSIDLGDAVQPVPVQVEGLIDEELRDSDVLFDLAWPGKKTGWKGCIHKPSDLAVVVDGVVPRPHPKDSTGRPNERWWYILTLPKTVQTVTKTQGKGRGINGGGSQTQGSAGTQASQGNSPPKKCDASKVVLEHITDLNLNSVDLKEFPEDDVKKCWRNGKPKNTFTCPITIPAKSFPTDAGDYKLYIYRWNGESTNCKIAKQNQGVPGDIFVSSLDVRMEDVVTEIKGTADRCGKLSIEASAKCGTDHDLPFTVTIKNTAAKSLSAKAKISSDKIPNYDKGVFKFQRKVTDGALDTQNLANFVSTTQDTLVLTVDGLKISKTAEAKIDFTKANGWTTDYAGLVIPLLKVNPAIPTRDNFRKATLGILSCIGTLGDALKPDPKKKGQFVKTGHKRSTPMALVEVGKTHKLYFGLSGQDIPPDWLDLFTLSKKTENLYGKSYENWPWKNAHGDNGYMGWCTKTVDGDVTMIRQIDSDLKAAAVDPSTPSHRAFLYVDRPMCNCCGAFCFENGYTDRFGNVQSKLPNTVFYVNNQIPYDRWNDNLGGFYTNYSRDGHSTNSFPSEDQNVFAGVKQHKTTDNNIPNWGRPPAKK